MIKSLVIVLSLVAVGGCSKKADKSEGGGAAKTTEPAEAAKKPELTGAWFGTKPGLPGALAKVKFGGSGNEPMPTEDLEDISFHTFVGDVRNGVSMTFPLEKRELVEKAWGKGLPAKRATEEMQVWFVPDQTLRIELTAPPYQKGKAQLSFYKYTPLATLLGEGKYVAVLGEDLSKAPKEFGKPEWELGSGVPLSCNDTKDGKTCRFSINFTAETKAETIAVLEKKWGKSTPTEINEFLGGTATSELYNKAAPRVTVSVKEPYGGQMGEISFAIESK